MTPTLLIAAPQMRDPFFERTVVLVWHHDGDGAIGVVVNRPLAHKLGEVLDLDAEDLAFYRDTRVAWGGPVENSSGTVVAASSIPDEDGWNLPDGLAVTRSQEVLVKLIRRQGPLLLCLGYAGWGAGQLDKEIQEGGWLFTEPSRALLFESAPEERYERALATLGLTPATAWMRAVDE
jgi:putative transcriptional regulator